MLPNLQQHLEQHQMLDSVTPPAKNTNNGNQQMFAVNGGIA